MESAFGIEHGEFSKARRPKQKPTNQVRGNLRQVGQKVTSARVSLTDVGNATGKTVGGVGRALQAKPGLTGAVVVGGGAGALYARSQKKPHAPKGM